MQHGIDGVLLENPVQQGPVTDIPANHQRTFAANGFHRVQGGVAAVAKIIQNYNFITCFK